MWFTHLFCLFFFFFFKQKTAYELRISDWSSDVCSSDLGPKPATLFVRPRGWHLLEKHVIVDGVPMSGGLFDFGLYFFHNAKIRKDQGKGTYFYLPKMESHLEARLWNQVFDFSEDTLKIPRGTIRGPVLIGPILAA